jgi:hypothetical protein
MHRKSCNHRLVVVLSLGCCLNLSAAAEGGAAFQTQRYTIHGEARTRWEGPTDLGFRQGVDDDYLLTRLRLSLSVRLTRAISAMVEVQDARAPGYNRPVPGSAADGVDIRQAWVQLGSSSEGGVSLRAGRQPLRLGSGRVVWDPDWNNGGQVFDGALLTVARGSAQAELVAAAPVDPLDRAWDHRKRGVTLGGVYLKFKMKPIGLRLEPYFLIRGTKLPITSEAEYLAVSGLRVLGQVAKPLGFEFEFTTQNGRVLRQDLRAWGLVSVITWKPMSKRVLPALTGTYTYASGGVDLSTGQRHTLQAIFPTNHLRYGATDRLGWSNLRDIMAEAKWPLHRRIALSHGVHLPSLANVRDALYSRNGQPILVNPNATSTFVGTELYLLMEAEVARNWSLGSGVAHLFHGSFLRQSNRPGGTTQPYVYLTGRF